MSDNYSEVEEAELPWLPMRTAPRDGSEVLLAVKWRAGIYGKMLVGHYMPGGYCVEDHPAIETGWYFWNGCMFDRAAEPLHWMKLPPNVAMIRDMIRDVVSAAQCLSRKYGELMSGFLEGDSMSVRYVTAKIGAEMSNLRTALAKTKERA